MNWPRFFQATFIVYVLLVSYFSLSQPAGITDIGTWDKLAHAGAYTVFALLCGLMTRRRRHFWLAIGFCCSFGLAIEYLQSLTGYRSGSWGDIIANVGGMMLGIGLIQVWQHLLTVKKGTYQD